MLKLWSVSHGDSYDHSHIGYVVAESEDEALFEGRKLACRESRGLRSMNLKGMTVYWSLQEG